MTVETIRTNLNPMLERRWLSCGNQPMCNAMADLITPALLERINTASKSQMFADQTWLSTQLERFSGPPFMELRTLEPNEFESNADYYAILFRVPLPDSNNPENFFGVGRLGFSEAAMHRDRNMLKLEVKKLFQALVLHEVKEWLKFDGQHVEDPHPEEN